VGQKEEDGQKKDSTPADFQSWSHVPTLFTFALSTDSSSVCAQTLALNDLQTGLYEQDDVPTNFPMS
jgi:hypothetical protein